MMLHNSAASSQRAQVQVGRARRPGPTRSQVATARQLLDWYFDEYHGRSTNIGTLDTFTDESKVGAFAVSASALKANDERSLFRLLIAVTMFQRRQDQQILRILRSLSPSQVADLTNPQRLLARCNATRCACLKTTATLHVDCDLTKVPGTSRGVCRLNPRVRCHLKQHTILLRRYGHFGKVPTSAALTLHELGVAGVAQLRAQIWAAHRDPRERAEALEAALCRMWRVSRKIAAMYLSMLTVPGLSRRAPIWRGLDCTRFVAIDSNTDQFLMAVGYRGPWSYDARLTFITSITSDLAREEDGLGRRPVNARLVQQAMYIFMGRINRRANPRDCAYRNGACRTCPASLRKLCPVKVS